MELTWYCNLHRVYQLKYFINYSNWDTRTNHERDNPFTFFLEATLC